MEKKINFSDKSVRAKVIYAAVIAILCITAIVVGIVSASSRSKDPVEVKAPMINNNNNDVKPPVNDPATEDKTLSFIAPTAGKVTQEHSMEIPVFSVTLGEWRVHTGIDISCNEGAGVFASEAGIVTGIYSDPMLGYTIEITHDGNIKTRYSNLSSDVGNLKVGDAVDCGERIGYVGDTSVSELAEEPHLHFEVLLKNTKVNPLDYISKESKKASLGIE